MWFTRTVDNCRCLFFVESSGALRTGLASSDFVSTIVDPGDSATISPTVFEYTQKPGIYYMDVPSSFFTTHGTGHYLVVVEVNTIGGPSGQPDVVAVFGTTLQVSQEDFDSIGTSVSSLNDISTGDISTTINTILDARNLMAARVLLLDELDANTAGSVGDDARLARQAATNRLEVTGFGTVGNTTLTLYDDDGITPLLDWDLATDGGEAVITHIGVQTKRGAPTP